MSNPQLTTHGSARIAANSRACLVVREVPNIIIMVAGTTRPVNVGGSRAHSHSKNALEAQVPNYWKKREEDSTKDTDWYWLEDEELRTRLVELTERYRSLAILTLHGWSGDNAIGNRRIAGTYLADRLCGDAGELAFYEGWLEREVHFHLIGHSHGGNVINEFTTRVAASEKWPERWKVRSLTYLSTPFFQRLHPLETDALDPECTIIHAHNDFDLTQRIIADFSMLPLEGIREQGGIPELLDAVSQLRFDFPDALETLTPTGVTAFDATRGLEITLDPAEAATLYDSLIVSLMGLQAVFARLRDVVERLRVGLTFEVAKEFQGKIAGRRRVMSDALAVRCNREIDSVTAGFAPALAALRARRAGSVFTLSRLMDDFRVLTFVDPLLRFLEVDPTILRGPLWDLVHDLLVEQIEDFDNTTVSPSQLVRGTPFENRVVDVDVTDRDPFSDLGNQFGDRFTRFVQHLERVESLYLQHRRPTDLLEMVFTLLAQVEPVRKAVDDWAGLIDWVGGATRVLAWQDRVSAWLPTEEEQPLLQTLSRFARVAQCYAKIIQDRDVGGLESSRPGYEPPLGSLEHFAVVSHSVSRRHLHPGVKEALESSFSTCRKRSAR